MTTTHAIAPAPDDDATFVVSLDFELRWGRHDRLGLDADAYRENLETERAAVPLLLEAFAARGLRVTWATVGALACRSWTEYFARAPKPPRFHDPRLAVDARAADLDPDGRLHFAPELVQQIRHAPGQELGTHTFSHLPLREPGVTADDAAADLDAVVALWKERCGAAPRSLVFPRNQCAFLDVARRAGIRVWRGNPRAAHFDRQEAATNGFSSRARRWLDDVNPRLRHAAPLEGDMTRASLFLRLGLPAPAWRLHVRRIRGEISALVVGQIFHLWWHPHNLGRRPEAGLGRVIEVLDLVAERASRGLLVSRTMGELVP